MDALGPCRSGHRHRAPPATSTYVAGWLDDSRGIVEDEGHTASPVVWTDVPAILLPCQAWTEVEGFPC